MNYYKRKKKQNYKTNTQSPIFNEIKFKLMEKKLIEMYGKDYYKGYTKHNGLNEIPPDYVKPEGFNDDFGLLLKREGIKEHSLCFPKHKGHKVGSMVGSMMSFPFCLDENPDDYINTTFMDRRNYMVRGNMITLHFHYHIGNQTSWLSKKIEKNQNVVNPDKLTEMMCFSLWFNNLNLMNEFVTKYESEDLFYCKVRLRDKIIRNVVGDKIEYYNEIDFIGFEDRSVQHKEYYDKLYGQNVL